MNQIWYDEDWWNIIHIFSSVLEEPTEKNIFYDIMLYLSRDTNSIPTWLKQHKKRIEHDDLLSWTYQLKKTVLKVPKSDSVLRIKYDKNSITKDVWGHYLWKWFHKIVVELCPTDFQNIFLQFITILPCPICRKHAIEYQQTHVFTDDMETWLRLFHNDVSKRINTETGTKKKIWE